MKELKKLTLMVLTICLLTSFLFGAKQEKMRIAIMDLQGLGVDEATAKAVSDILRTEMFNTGLFRVLERAEVDAVLKEQGFQMSGCTESECAVQIGKILSANKVLVGTVNKLGEAFIINARIVDVERAEVDFAENTKVASLSKLDEGCKMFARKIASRIQSTAKSEEVKEKVEPESKEISEPERAKKGGLRLRTASYIVTGLSIIPTVAGILVNEELNKEYDKYKNLNVNDTLNWTKEDWDSEWQSIEDIKKSRNTLYTIAGITAGVGVTMFLVDLIFLKPKSSEQAYNNTKPDFFCLIDSNKVTLSFYKRF